MILPNRTFAVFKDGCCDKNDRVWLVTCDKVSIPPWHYMTYCQLGTLLKTSLISMYTVQNAACSFNSQTSLWKHFTHPAVSPARAKSECHCHLQTKGSCSYCNPRHPLFMNHYQGLCRDQWIKMIHDNVVNAVWICTLNTDTQSRPGDDCHRWVLEYLKAASQLWSGI